MVDRNDDISTRLKVNRAEQMAEGYFAQQGSIIPFGFAQSDTILPGRDMGKVPQLIRKAPDFVFIKDGEAIFIEVKGMAFSEKTFNLKIDDFAGYCFWNELMPVSIFIVRFSKTGDDMYLTPFNTIKKLVNEQEYQTGQYGDTQKRYFQIDYSDLVKL